MSKKIQISKNIKEKIWTNYFGNKSNEYCPSCMKNIITNNSFHAGHIIAEAKGGLTFEDNLIPICKNCNLDMGQKNLIDFAKSKYNNIIKCSDKYYLYEKQINDGINKLYNTKQIMKKQNIINIIGKLLNDIKSNNLLNEEIAIIKIENNYIDKIYNITYEISNFSNISIKIIKNNYNEYHKCYIEFDYIQPNIYKIRIKSNTEEVRKNYENFTFDQIKKIDFNTPKMYGSGLYYNIIYDEIFVKDKKYILIDNFYFTIVEQHGSNLNCPGCIQGTIN
jgi:hypothetical protein